MSSDEGGAAARAERVLGTVPDDGLVEVLLARAAGHPSLTDHLVSAWRDAGSIERGSLVSDPDMTPSDVADAVVEMQAELGPEARTALTALSIGPALDDRLLVALCDRPVEAAPAIWQELRAAGVLVPDHEEPLPVVADAVAARIEPSTRRDLHRRIAELLTERGAPPAQIAEHVVAAGMGGPEWVSVLVAAAEAQLPDAPQVARELLDHAVAAGADPVELAGVRAEATALTGDEDAAAAIADGALGGPASSVARASVVLAGVLARRGLWARAGRTYFAVSGHPVLPDDALRALGGVAAVAVGEEARTGTDGAPTSLAADVARLLGQAAAAAGAGDATAARRAAGEAADLVETTATPVVLPETPHALASTVALMIGDTDDAERCAMRALEAGVGGPAAAMRHRLLAGFAALRAGRWDRVQGMIDAVHGPGTTRDALLRATLTLGLARRANDVGKLAAAWEVAAPVVRAVRADTYLVPALCELTVSAARLGERQTLHDRELELDALLASLGAPGLWTRPVAWARVEAAVAANDPDDLDARATALAATDPAHPRLAGLDAATHAWRALLRDGACSEDDLEAAVAGLEQAGLVWEASRLVGHAAIRADDPGDTRSLLGRARALHGTLPVLDEAGVPTGTVLSEREREVAAGVVDGLTHKEIGAMLFISPKTVEHHVARIRQKLGAGSRAELLAGLRATLAAAD